MNTIVTLESAYSLDVNYADTPIGTLTLDKATNLLKLKYNEHWQKMALQYHLAFYGRTV